MQVLEPLVTADAKGLVESFSPEAVELFGWSPDEVVGSKRLSTFHRKGDLAELLPRMMGTAQEKGVFQEEVTMRRKDGSEFRAKLTVMSLQEGGQMVGYGIHAVEV